MLVMLVAASYHRSLQFYLTLTHIPKWSWHQKQQNGILERTRPGTNRHKKNYCHAKTKRGSVWFSHPCCGETRPGWDFREPLDVGFWATRGWLRRIGGPAWVHAWTNNPTMLKIVPFCELDSFQKNIVELPERKRCRMGRHRQEGKRCSGRMKDMLDRRWRSSGGSPPPPPPRSPPPTSHPPLPEARHFSLYNLGALLPPDNGSTGSKVPDIGRSRNSPPELPPMDLCTERNRGLRIVWQPWKPQLSLSFPD